MITIKKIKEYNDIQKIHEYSSQLSVAINQSSLTDHEFKVLNKFYDDLEIIRNGLASEIYRQKFMYNINVNCEEEALNYLLNIVEEKRNPTKTDFGKIWKKILNLFK